MPETVALWPLSYGRTKNGPAIAGRRRHSGDTGVSESIASSAAERSEILSGRRIRRGAAPSETSSCPTCRCGHGIRSRFFDPFPAGQPARGPANLRAAATAPVDDRSAVHRTAALAAPPRRILPQSRTFVFVQTRNSGSVAEPGSGPPIPASTASSRLTGTGNSGAALGRSSPASGLGWRWDAAKFGARRKDALVERAPLYECAGVAAPGSYGRHRQALADEERPDLFLAARSLGIAAKRPLHVRRCR